MILGLNESLGNMAQEEKDKRERFYTLSDAYLKCQVKWYQWVKTSFFVCLVVLNSQLSQAAVYPAYDTLYFNKLADAIYHAEGGAKTRHPYGVLSVRCTSHDACRRICINTLKSMYKRFKSSNSSQTYLSFLAASYAPLNAKNDPAGLNKNWIKNVEYFLNKPGIPVKEK